MFKRLKFYLFSDRIGPDMFLTHWILYSKTLSKIFLRNKFYNILESVEIRPFSFLVNTKSISLGKNTVIRPGCMLFGDKRVIDRPSITIEDNVLMGSGVHIYVSNHKFDKTNEQIIDQGWEKPKPVIIHKGAWLGANTVILPGVEIGEHSVVGACSVVIKKIPSYSVAAGNPAKVIKHIKN